MKTFPLRIGTSDGLLFEGSVERVVCRGIAGELAILAGHCNFCTALGMGEAYIVTEGGKKGSGLYRRNAVCDRWHLPSSGNYLGMAGRYRR